MKSKSSKEKMLRRMNQDPEGHARLKDMADGKTGLGHDGKVEAKAALNANHVRSSKLKPSHLSPQKPEGKSRAKSARYT